MGTFNTKKVLYGSAYLIPTIADRIQQEFMYDGYQVAMDALSSGGYDISITKGGLFKAVLGMKTALKITLTPADNSIYFEAGVGIWGQQAIPTAISMLIFLPVLITQIWGIVEQSKLDDKALEIAQDVIRSSGAKVGMGEGESPAGVRFCTACGTKNVDTAKFCCGCGKQL
ncbi:MAG: zinc ribbon domain-containing protein [Bacteroidales bacterium]|nr:zinc ribbon domain-containing protein [Bacteroidales bacterium]